MPLETVTFIDDLVVTNPVGATDDRRFGDDHIRNLKTGMKNTFPFATSPRPFERVEVKDANYTIVPTDDKTLFKLIPPNLAGITLTLPSALAAPEAVVGRWSVSFYKANFNDFQIWIDSAGGDILADYGIFTGPVPRVRRSVFGVMTTFVWLGGSTWLATRACDGPIASIIAMPDTISSVQGYIVANGGSFDASEFPELANVLGGTTRPLVPSLNNLTFMVTVE